jgi:Ca-activated chloride channel family protein
MTRSWPLRRRACTTAALAVIAVAAALAAQSGGASLRIVAPADGSYISGPLVIVAGVEPAGAAVDKLTFFADGQVVCTVQAPPFECPWDAGAGVRAHVIRVVASLADGTRLVRNVRTLDGGFVENVDVEVVQVTAIVTDSRGQFVRGLGREAFRILEDGAPQRIDHFGAESVPLEIVVAVDASRSMTAALPRVKLAVKTFLAALQPADRVTVLAFNDNVFTIARPEVDPAARLRSVDRLSAWGRTALYDAIVRGHELLGRQRSRRALVVFTDGDDQASRHPIEAVQEAVETSDVALYFVAYGRGIAIRPLRERLEQLAAVSGGRALFSQRMNDLEQDFARITEELTHQYLLSYVPENRARDDTWRRITVELPGASHRVRARQGYRVVSRAQ